MERSSIFSSKNIADLFDEEIQRLEVEKKNYERKAKIYSYLRKRNLRGLKWTNPSNLLEASINYLYEFLYTEKIIANERIISMLN